MYRIVIKRTNDNPLLNGKHYNRPLAQYRVVMCYPAEPYSWRHKVVDCENNEWLLLVRRPQRHGTLINPRKALNI